MNRVNHALTADRVNYVLIADGMNIFARSK